MKHLTLVLMFLCSSCCGCTSDMHLKSMNMHAGRGYIDSVNACLLARDLTDDEMDDADNLPGGGYSDGKWTGENPPTEEDEDGNPTYAAQHVWEDDNGTIIILEDDGEITEVETA